MIHRHLNPTGWSLAMIDDLIARGKRADWEELRRLVLADAAAKESVRQLCMRQVHDPYAQRYHFWLHYVTDRPT
ncbi:MAG: hypothetical protein JO353_09185 [Phycisphaerae bacterium]|nr:hypothetical protein [Phycisphaerae bacterium]